MAAMVSRTGGRILLPCRSLSGVRQLVVGNGIPHFLEIVEVADFRAKEMNDDVACIDENPIVCRDTLDLGRAVPGVLEVTQQPISHRAYMAVRTAICDDHMIRNRGFSGDVDMGNLFGL